MVNALFIRVLSSVCLCLASLNVFSNENLERWGSEEQYLVNRYITIPNTKSIVEATQSTWQSKLVHQDEDGSLSYFPDSLGYIIPDFGSSGYRGGGIELPDVRVVKEISALSGDNTHHIQSAIDEVASMKLVNGIRGTVLLKAGLYRISGSININKDGIVLRGEGQGESPDSATILLATGNIPEQRVFINLGNAIKPNRWDLKLTQTVKITDQYVVAGNKEISLESTQMFSVGDQIVLRHDASLDWLDAIGGGVGASGAAPWTMKDKIDIVYNRYITNIDRSTNTVTLDAPVYYSLDKSLSESYVYKMSDTNIIKNIGVENLRIDSEFDNTIDTLDVKRGRYLCDEAHAWTGVRFISAEDAWTKNVTVIHFGGFGISTTSTTRSTIKDCEVIEPISIITGDRRYAFNTASLSQLILFENCYAQKARHGFVSSGTSSASGIVFLRCKSDWAYASSEGHRRWSQGFLYDNMQEVAYNGTYKHTLALNNRGSYGTSHGWGLVTSVAWNCDLTANDSNLGHLIVQCPPTAQNFAIACKANAVDGKGPFLEPEGYIEGSNRSIPIQPESLYEAQVQNKKINVGVGVFKSKIAAKKGAFKIIVSRDNLKTLEQSQIPPYSMVKIYSIGGILLNTFLYEGKSVFNHPMLANGIYLVTWNSLIN